METNLEQIDMGTKLTEKAKCNHRSQSKFWTTGKTNWRTLISDLLNLMVDTKSLSPSSFSDACYVQMNEVSCNKVQNWANLVLNFGKQTTTLTIYTVECSAQSCVHEVSVITIFSRPFSLSCQIELGIFIKGMLFFHFGSIMMYDLI